MPEPQRQPDQDDLVIRMMDGDQEALAMFLADQAPRVKACLARKFGLVLDENEREDVLQIAAHRLWNSIGRYDSRAGTAGGYFLRIAENAARDLLRGRRRRPFPVLPGDEFDPPEEPRHLDPDPRENACASALRSEVEKLAPMERNVCMADLAAGGEADTDRLIEVTGSTRGGVLKARSTARKKLRDAFAKLGLFREKTRTKT
jgi:DNA-directed RNA polymerase specialized sigma24 family protein